jgi:bifunctional isochorismate lyase / aryl carrier protein
LNLKETYLRSETFDDEISRLKDEISLSIHRRRQWNADLNHSALIVTDMQNYFLSPSSHAFIPSAQAIIPNIIKLINIFRENDRPLIFTKHINNKENAGSMNYWWNDLVNDDGPLAELYDDLRVSQDIILTKHQYDAFHETKLEDLLKSRQTLYPVVCGVMSNLCCETTVRTAFVKGFRPVLPLDATAAYNREFHLATFRNLAFGFSPLLTTSEVITILTP